MQVFPSINQFKATPAASALLETLRNNEQALHLQESMLYHAFPLYRDEEGGLIVADVVLLSPAHGVVVFALTTESKRLSEEEFQRCTDVSEQVPSYVHSRLVKNRLLRKGPTRLAFDIVPVVYAPLLKNPPQESDYQIATSEAELVSLLEEIRNAATPMPSEMFKELIATTEGAKGLIRPKKRELVSEDLSSKGKQAELVEAAITLFDQQQKHGMMGRVTGPQRIRGLAGSGKTVVLAMKAAQMHLQFPDARIAYTFWTKSLYQHVKRLITRFYRQFDDRDPDWEKRLHVLHGWGSSSVPGIYSVACEQHKVPALSFQDAAARTPGDRFDYACKTLLAATSITPLYDFVFVDEGQDFPPSFLKLSHALAKDGKFVLAYDDLQTIFQPVAPSNVDIFGKDDTGRPNVVFEEDIVLHKCYRNPREVLVSAHALGFGVYGDRIVQMLESRDHWEDIGYTVKAGDFVAGSRIDVQRPEENSLAIVSEHSSFGEIVKAAHFTGLDDECVAVAQSIERDIADGLQPDDILVVSVDDRCAKSYLSTIEAELEKRQIKSNNLQSDSFGIRDFSKDGRVTLSTVHKAKGNEAFMVYVVGMDAALSQPDVRRRNMLFTAMTRTKGWVRMTGVGDGAKRCMKELEFAKINFPSLVFTYPGPEDLQIMKRDLADAADKKIKARRLIEQLQEDLTDEEIEQMLKESKSQRGAKTKRFKKGGSQ
jgi:superfamily I DNA and RNA helicase